MNEKTLITLEYPRVLERLAKHTSFALSAEKALRLHPTSVLQEAVRRQKITSEARQLLELHPVSIGGVRDVRQPVNAARRGMILTPLELLDVQSTLVAARDLGRTFERFNNAFPHLSEIVSQLPKAPGLVDAISRAVSERGNILDTASARLQTIRSEIRVTHDRLLNRLQHMVNAPQITPYLQESLVTQREGRYVIPLKAEFKGRIKAVVHDQSASGVTLFVEPLSVLEMNNKFKELQLEEREEEQRILAALSQQVAEYAEQILYSAEICARLDLAFACAKYAQELGASEPILRPRQPARDQSHPGTLIRLWQARHPLLNPESVVPVDIELDPQTFSMVITGPNTGGKTVCLKTIGLLVLMAQSGLHIPAQPPSELSVFQHVFADIGDEQSIEQSLSTFSGHITNIIHILKRADMRSLVILDELGAGTDPQEGALLARALLSYLLEKRITTMVTTHHPELKAFAHATAGVTNAAVEFDIESMQPTYRLIIGIPGKSNALAIAQRLGLPQEIINNARAQISAEDLRAEDLLEEIHRQRDKARCARNAAEKAAREVETLRKDLSRRLASIADERSKLLDEARLEASQELADLRREIEQMRRSLQQARQSQAPLETYLERVSELEEDIEEAGEILVEQSNQETTMEELPSVSTMGLTNLPIVVGTKVFLKSLGAEGVVTAINDEQEEAEVQVGVMRMRARLSMLNAVAAPTPSPGANATSEFIPLVKPDGEGMFHASPGMELDLRGAQVEDALERLDRYLEAAYLAGLPFCRIIHGKGTGRLRVAVRQLLSRHPTVSSHENGREGEGGDGVTIVKFGS